jgi:hypothetical protein
MSDVPAADYPKSTGCVKKKSQLIIFSTIIYPKLFNALRYGCQTD